MAINVMGQDSLPDALQVHGANLHNVANLFALENTVASATRHASHIQELGTIDHVVV